MPRADKVAAVNDVSQHLTEATATVLTEYRGLSVDDLAELRARLRETDATYRVVKNTLTRLAAKDAGVDIPDAYLVGPTAVTFCAGDPVAAAKVLRTFSKQHPQLVIKGGVLDGRLLDAAETTRLADLESRQELLARLAGMMQALVAQPARLAQASLTKFARLLAALQDRKADEPQDVTAAVETETAAEAPAGDATADATAVEAEAAAEASAGDAREAAESPAAESADAAGSTDSDDQ
ncbi:MAG: 50S ribosomal protein L10 [Actinobacteria bacterium]|nr:50S ribosomal protein L10 [Actinomycetota bacterium]